MMTASKKFISCFLVFALVSSTAPVSVWAEDPEPMFNSVSPMQKGDRAPFDGILLSKDLASKIEADRKTMVALKICNANTKAEVDSAKSVLTKQLDEMTAKYNALDEKHERLMEIKEEELEFFRKSYQPPPWYKEPAFLISMGLIAGAGLSVGAAYIVKLVK